MSPGVFAGKRWWMLAVLLVVGLMGALVWFANVSRPRILDLPDGSHVEFLRVTYGTNHVVELQPWHLRLRSGLAARFPKFLKPRPNFSTVSPLTSSNDSVVVWFRRTKSPGSTLGPLDVFALDSARTACREPTRTSQSYQSLTQEVAGYLFTAFPRREKQFLVACTIRDPSGSSTKTLAEFAIPLHRGPSNAWSAGKFPVTKPDGDLTFSLTRLQTGIDFIHREKPATNVFDGAVLAGFRVSQGDRTLTNWQPGKIWMTDGSGNQADSSFYSNYEKNGEQLLCFRWGLWPTEPAWKLRTEFTRTGGFESNEVWRVSIPALPLIPERTFYNWKQSNWLAKTTLNGDVLKIVGLREDYQQGGKGNPLPFTVEMEASPPRQDFRITLLEITDENGRKLERGGFGWGAGNATYRIEDLGSAKALNLVVAYHKNRYVEFIAKPERFVEDKSDAKSR